MTRQSLTTASIAGLVAIALFISIPSGTQQAVPPKTNPSLALGSDGAELQAVGHPTFASPHSNPIAVSGDHVFVVNTPADSVDVIDAGKQQIIHRISVGVDPVSVAMRPDQKELWVSNHVSDSVSVIDTVKGSPTYLQVIATIQDFDSESKATLFDEPIGIAFANNSKAYVALSSENQIAVIDVDQRTIRRRLKIPAQDPRSIVVRRNRLYVIPFESNNKTQLSGGARDDIDGDLVTFDAWQHSVVHNNVLSLGHTVDIIKHPDVPDRDLFVYDTETDKLVEVVESLGTLLYGMAVDSKGNAFIAQTDARNDVNGRAGSKKHGLQQLENRAFLNQITRVDFHTETHATKKIFELEPLPPNHPTKDMALATPFAIQVTEDDANLVVTAAGSDKLFTMDAETGEVLGRVNVGIVPRGIAIAKTKKQDAQAWVYNAVANSVTVVDLSEMDKPQVAGFVRLEDPTDRDVKLGRTWFNDADASSTGTFSCASCHPDGHTDQLLWVLKTPIVTGGDQIMPRSTMPIRGLRDTAPFHWDGIPGDPYGGNNSAQIHGSVPPNSDPEKPETSTRHVIDGGLASTMLADGDQTVNDEGKPGFLSTAQRDDMAKFLLCVPYPPAQKRAYTNVLSKRAEKGYELFHIKGHHDEKPKPNVCGDCHRMPFLVSTNTPGTGMDAPTWRGAYDRFLILPQGRLNIIEFDFYRRIAEQGIPERKLWQFSWQGQPRFDPIWDMVLENSTGYSGTFARQVTLSESTVNDAATKDLLAALESSARDGAVVLEANGVVIDGETAKPFEAQFVTDAKSGAYHDKTQQHSMTIDEMMALAGDGKFIGTFTARHGHKVDLQQPQPAIWTTGPIQRQRGHQDFPVLYQEQLEMTVSGRHIEPDALVYVDGKRVDAWLELGGNESIQIRLAVLPPDGMHLLQIQNQSGLFSNDFIFNVVQTKELATELRNGRFNADMDIREKLAQAISKNQPDAIRELLNRRQQRGRVNEQQPSTGSTPLSNAALYGHKDIAEILIRRGADVNGTNRDGNTPLHVAAFLCRADIVKLLLEKGASPTKDNRRGESAIEVVAGDWDDRLAAFYNGIANAVEIKIDLKEIQKQRPKIKALLEQAK